MKYAFIFWFVILCSTTLGLSDVRKSLSRLHSRAILKTTLHAQLISNVEVLPESFKTNNGFKLANSPKIVFAGMFAASTIAIGVTTAQVVLWCKRCIAYLDTTVNTRIPNLAPILGSMAVCLLYAVDNNLGVNPFTLPLIVNKRRTHSEIKKSGPRMASEFVLFESHKMKGGKSFSILRQLMRVLATVLVLGTGCSLGLTAASAEIGMTLAHLCGYFLPVVNREPINDVTTTSSAASQDLLSSEVILRNIQYRTYLLLAGAAAGVAANFNAPLTGLFYSLEIGSQLLSVVNYQQLTQSTSSNAIGTSGFKLSELLGAVGASVLVSVLYMRAALPSSVRPLLSCSSSSVSSISGITDSCVSYLHYVSPLLLSHTRLDWLYFCTMGVVGGVTAMSVSSLRGLLSRVLTQFIPSSSRPLLAGLYCSRYGQSNRVAFMHINSLFNNDLSNDWRVPSISLMSKVLSFVVCSSSGLIGGHMAPSLFIGSSLGAVVSHILQPTLSSSVPPSLAVMLGAVAFISASFKAPITAVLLLMELTHSHYQRVLVPLLVSSLVAYFISKLGEGIA